MKRYFQTKVPLGDDGLLPRTGLAVGKSAPHVLIPGDPHRSKKISTFFRDAEFTAHRGTFATFTGHTDNGTDIAVTSSGMGPSCVTTVLEELADAGAKTVIRVGTCGGVQPWMKPGTIVIASGCVRGEGASYELVPPEFPAVAHPIVVSALTQAAEEMGEDYLVGLYRSHDAFYMESKAAHPGLRERMQKWIDTGVLVVENESGTLFTYSHLLGLRSGCICVALGSMFDETDGEKTTVYGAYADPDFLAKRIETASRIAMRACEIIEEVTK
jgi:uridine phosphorylase